MELFLKFKKMNKNQLNHSKKYQSSFTLSLILPRKLTIVITSPRIKAGANYSAEENIAPRERSEEEGRKIGRKKAGGGWLEEDLLPG